MIAGVDIGGTKVAAALLNESGEISHRARVPVVTTGNAATAFLAVTRAIDTVLRARLRHGRGAESSEHAVLAQFSFGGGSGGGVPPSGAGG